MELKNLLHKLITEAKEEEVNNFIANEEGSIIDGILKLWDKHQQKASTIGNAEAEKEQNGTDQELSDNNDEKTDKFQLIDKAENTIDAEVADTPMVIDNMDDVELIDSDLHINNDNIEKTDEDMGLVLPNNGEQQHNDKAKEAARNEAFRKQLSTIHISLPNGKVNQEYEADFDIDKLAISDIGNIAFEGLEDLGLEYNADEKRIKGKPTKAGDHSIKIKFKRSDWEDGKPIFERNVVLIINPDPRSLWNNIATPSSTPYYKPDSDKGFVMGSSKAGKKSIVVASQRGRSHAHEGKPRDDDFGMFFDESTGWYIVTVADGAGSAKFSRRGSQIACQTVIEVCKAKLAEMNDQVNDCIKAFNKEKEKTVDKRRPVLDNLYHILGTAAFKAYKTIEKESIDNQSPIKDYSTTLIVSVCKKFKFGWFIGAFWVGDGGIGIYDKKTSFLKILGEPDGGEFAGQTRFLTMPEVMQAAEIYRRLRFDIVDDFTSVVLMTDGITDPKFETDANLSKIEKWNNLWDDLSAEVDFNKRDEGTADQLLKWLDFWSPGNHDDRTIALLY